MMKRALFILLTAGALFTTLGAAGAQPDDPFAETTGRVALTPPENGEPVIVDITLPGPGYLAVEAETAETPVTAQIIDADGRTLGVDSARVSQTEGLTTRLVAGPAGFPPAITLRFRPEMDYTEPNDRPELAWPVAVEAITQAVLFPAGDIDHFSFTLSEPASLSLEFLPEQAADYALIDPQTGEPIEDLSELTAGDYVLRLSAREAAEDFTPLTVEFRVLAGPPASALEALAGAGALQIEPFRPAPVPAGQDQVEAQVRIEDAGIYSVRLSNAGPDAAVSIQPAAGGGALTWPAPLAPGAYTLTIENADARIDGPPVFVTLLHEPAPPAPEAAPQPGGADPAEEEAGETPVYVIGVEMTDEVRDIVATQVEASGGRFVTAAEASEVAAAIQEIAREQDRGRSGPPWMALLLVVIAAGGAGVYWMRRRP